jgi:hypothetical protein
VLIRDGLGRGSGVVIVSGDVMFVPAFAATMPPIRPRRPAPDLG